MLNNHQAEATTLAGIIKYPDAFWSINSVDLRAGDFMGPSHRKVMKAVLAVAGDRKSPEYPLVVEELSGSDDALAFIEGLLKVPVSVPQAIESAGIVKGLSTARQLQSAGAAIITLAEERRADSDGAMAEAESLLRAVRATLPMPDRSPDPGDILVRIQNPRDVASIPIRFSPTLNSMTGGMQVGHLWVVGGFSSTGKTLAATNFIFDALRVKKWVCVFSLEMTQEAYLIRLAAVASGIAQSTIKNRAFIGHDEVETVRKVEQWLATAPVRIYDTVFRLSDIRSRAITQKETLGLDLMIVDFIQNVYDTGDEVKDARTAILELQNLAKELNCTIIALSQVSNEYARSQNDGGSKSSNYYSFKGSGAIRDAADIGVMLNRDRYASPGLLDFDVVKNRHGEFKMVTMRVDLRTGRMVEESAYEGDDDE